MSALRKGQLAWCQHPRGGVAIGKLSAAEAMPAPYKARRRICGISFPEACCSPIDTVPVTQPVVAMSPEAAKALGVEFVQDRTLEWMRGQS